MQIAVGVAGDGQIVRNLKLRLRHRILAELHPLPLVALDRFEADPLDEVRRGHLMRLDADAAGELVAADLHIGQMPIERGDSRIGRERAHGLAAAQGPCAESARQAGVGL